MTLIATQYSRIFKVYELLDQVFISNKSNETNAIKELLELIDIEGSVITIDAIGTQKAIAKKIVEGKGIMY